MLDQTVEIEILGDKHPNKHYWQYLIIVGALTFAIAAQFTIFQEEYSTDICYYNNKCLHSLGNIKPFNHIISNVLYVVLGIIFIITVKCNRNEESGCGIHREKSLFISIGLCLMLVGIFSGLYHVCPSPLNFQFDTLYMYFSGAIAFLVIYHKRHQSKVPTAFSTYLFLTFIYYMSTISLFQYRTGIAIWVWFIADLAIMYVLIHGSINLYYSTDWPLSSNLFKKVYKSLKDYKNFNKPKLILVILVDVFTMSMIFYATFSNANIFTNWFLALFIVNMATYFIYYVIQKILHHETIKWYIWILLFIQLVTLGAALVFYSHAVTNKFLSHKESNELNEPCALFNYFDYHDIWHFLSAIGLYLLINIIYFIDNDLFDTPRSCISIF